MLRTKIALTSALAAVALAAVAAPVSSRMKSTKVEAGLCLTEGGGRFVGIPGLPGERIDRRLLRDVAYLERRFKIFVTDGFSTDPVHSANGEHPVGLALDIVPDKARGGSWADIDRLAEWAEPRQDDPVAPFRWVGYDGDSGHGRGHHLHLSWSHSPAKFGKPARSVYTLKCPRRARRGGGQSGSSGAGSGKPDKPAPPSGGADAGEPPPSSPSGGTTPRLAPPAAERSGVDG